MNSLRPRDSADPDLQNNDTRGCQACSATVTGACIADVVFEGYVHWGYGATAARLTPDQKVGSSNLSALILRWAGLWRAELADAKGIDFTLWVGFECGKWTRRASTLHSGWGSSVGSVSRPVAKC